MSFTTTVVDGAKALFGPSRTAASRRGERRMVGPDILRAVAILLVMTQHLPKPAAAGVLGAIKPYGWMGVDVFFVLSGFLIGGQLLRPVARGETPSLGGFWASRAFRILPAYLLVLGFYLWLPGFTDGEGMRPAWRYLTFTMNWGLDYSKTGTFTSAWSLCVEEWFYLTLPLLVLGLRRYRTPAPALVLALALLLGGAALRYGLWHDLAALPPSGPLFLKTIYYPTWTRLDGLLLGVLLAAARIYRPALWAKVCPPPVAAALGLAAIAGTLALIGDTGITLPLAGVVLVYPLFSLGCALLLSALVDLEPWMTRLRPPGVAFVARLAYSLYLVHKPIYHLLNDTLYLTGWSGWATYFGGAFAGAIALHYLVERPFLRLRDRVMARREPIETETKLAA
ncbi:MAG: acyltransferase [Caulobacter sp.]|nr:acyltransferase [Caulobacter sp.]